MPSTKPPLHRIPNPTCLLLLLLLLAPTHTHAQIPTPSTFIRRNNHGSVALGSFVYIDGGLYSQYANDSTTTVDGPNTNTVTLALDMRTSWTNATAPITSIPKGNAPIYFQPQFWPDESSSAFYSWSGSTPAGQAVSQKSLWKFSADNDGGGSWSLHSSSSSTTSSSDDTVSFTSLTRPVGGYSAVLSDTGYYIGGYATGDSDDVNFSDSDMVPVPGVVSFNFTSGAWRNASSEGWTQYGTGMRGQAAPVSFGGGGGLLVLLGGESGSRTALSNARGYLDFSSVAVYDPSADDGGGAWYSQVTTGEAPGPRDEFCMAAAEGENSTELFVFGGWTVSTGVTHNDSYVLSLPAFRWFKGPVNAAPRVGLTCHSVGSGRQVLVIGGQDNNNNSFRWENPDPWKQGLGIFDMTAMEWSDGYDADAAAYESPRVVKEWYGDEENAEPEWSSDTVKALFSRTTTTTTTSSASPSGDGTVSLASSSASATPSSKPNAGAIAGGVVGGVVALALVGFVLFCCRRRRQRASYPAAIGVVQELDNGQSKAELHGHSAAAELPTKMHQWTELPGSGPESKNREIAELPGITVRTSQLR